VTPTILSLILALPAGLTSLTQEFENPEACQTAAREIRERLVTGRVIPLICSSKR
jgi:hypothetical protein